jgi:hypothetical protein
MQRNPVVWDKGLTVWPSNTIHLRRDPIWPRPHADHGVAIHSQREGRCSEKKGK